MAADFQQSEVCEICTGNHITEKCSLFYDDRFSHFRQVNERCGVCTGPHLIDACPLFDENLLPSPTQRDYDPYSDTYNLGWRDHPRFSYALGQARPPQQLPSGSGNSLEDIVNLLATNTTQFQQDTRVSLQDLEDRLSQIASFMSRLEPQYELLTQRHSVTDTLELQVDKDLGRGHVLTNSTGDEQAVNMGIERGYVLSKERETEPELEQLLLPMNESISHEHALTDDVDDEKQIVEHELGRGHTLSPYREATDSDQPKQLETQPPLPQQIVQSQKAEEEAEFLEIFGKVEVNTALLDVIKHNKNITIYKLDEGNTIKI